MRRTPLTEGWSLVFAGRAVPATVPGSVHTDLMAAGVIEDPYRGLVEEDLRWMYAEDWHYSRVLDVEPAVEGERADLVFDGIDTVGVVRLGGAELGRTYNMHRSYRFDVTPHLRGGPLDLEVDLLSATAYAEEQMRRLGDRPRALASAPYNFVRKMACSFGWDWGPDLRTAGLWKPVRLERWSVARIASVRPLVTLDRVTLHVTVEHLDPSRPLTLTASVLGQESTVEVASSEATLVIDVPDAPVWWPAGYGDQPLCDLSVTLSTTDLELDRWERRVGFRTVSLDTSPDEFGAKFTISVNGRPIFVKGANWIPDDHFLTRITRDRLDRRLDQAVAANLNLLRVWGGGIFESDDFYAACDERGLLVWQDFLLACAAYAEDSPLWQEIEAEARENVVRLMPHPSLALFNGGNENFWGHEDWNWQQALGDRSWGFEYAATLFRDIVAALDPTRPYSPNSPSSPGYSLAQMHPNDPDHGSHHQWEVWNQIDYVNYRAEIPRFCSEFGFQGPPAWRTMADWMPAEDKEDPVFLLHQKAADGNGKLDRGMDPHLGVPSSFTDWHWAAQLNQARAVTYAIDHYRRWWPRTAGAVVWQLNDCWPVTSWAAVDSQERPKPLWYALRHAFAPRRLVFVGDDVVVLNDTDEPWIGSLRLSREAFDGRSRATVEIPVEAGPRSSLPIALPPSVASPPSASSPSSPSSPPSPSSPSSPSSASSSSAADILVARLDGETAVHTFAEDVELPLEPHPVSVSVARTSDGYAVTVTARSFARDVTLLPDRLAADAVVDDALVSLPAGDSVIFHVRTTADGLEEGLAAPPVLRTANDLRA
ncbi:glycoside hydrolase family 2 protein [Actinoplanes sp. CA-030573]|uniref:glycoside hydrolase family 2 protein n=1 Tax=Actinoplanes sp. CA-030573 TaxID=3239898 RepID=UPI003D8AEA66